MTSILLDKRPEVKLDISLSVSKVKTFQTCAAQYHYNYIQKLPTKSWEFLTWGKFLHEILETFHKLLIEGDLRQYSEIMTQSFQLSISNFKDTVTLQQKEEAKVILSSYIKQMTDLKDQNKLPTFLAVERDFFIDIDGKILLNGFIDRIQLDPDGVLHVADYKTTKDKKSLKDFDQLLTYAYVMCLTDPTLEKVRVSYILLRHNFELITREYQKAEIMAVEDRFLKYANEIQSERLFRPKPSNLCKFCSYLDLCAEGKAKVNPPQRPLKIGELDW